MKEIIEPVKTVGDTAFKSDAAKIPDFKIPTKNDNELGIKYDIREEGKEFNTTDSTKIPDFKTSNIVDSLQEGLEKRLPSNDGEWEAKPSSTVWNPDSDPVVIAEPTNTDGKPSIWSSDDYPSVTTKPTWDPYSYSDVTTEPSNGFPNIDTNDKSVVKEISPFSDKINSFIKTFDELKVYIDAGLEEGVINDKLVLKDASINPDLEDSKGRTNLERMKKGLAPLDEKGESYNLHHIGQKSNSPLAELKDGTHKAKDGVLHDPTIKESEIDKKEFAKERAAHWKARAEEIEAKIKEGE